MAKKNKFWDFVVKFQIRLLAVFIILSITGTMIGYAYKYSNLVLNFYTKNSDFIEYKKSQKYHKH